MCAGFGANRYGDGMESLATPTAQPTLPPTPTPTTALPTEIPATAPISDEAAFSYDLDALLAEARDDLGLGSYTAAIDTLDAIISLDDEFQRELVRKLILDALTAQALTLYRRFDLAEAIVLTDRAEAYGNIDDLQFERAIALLYLDGVRYKLSNPGLAVRSFSDIVYTYSNPNYKNGAVMGELQEALGNYADALALQGDHCLAQEQYAAALSLQPPITRVNRGQLQAKRDQAALACQEAVQAGTGIAPIEPAGTPATVGVRSDAAPAPFESTGKRRVLRVVS